MTSRYLFHQMDDTDARKVAGWRKPPYDFYDWDADLEDLMKLRDAEQRKGVYFSVRNKQGQFVGFFQFEKDDTVDVGLEMRPDLAERGLGAEFVLAGLAFAREWFSPERFTPSVATFNGRTINMHETNGGEHEFLSMRRAA